MNDDRIGKPRKKIRCAIYTRKSSEEGLDQDFNSLDAQREACEAYISSQKQEGWVLLPGSYDDGGISGGTMERPSLQRLFCDVDDGRVDQIVVYKIDRLTRSLADFAKLVERLDKADASFVSVTQSFNTATSMGRLTLNVLLSFAQFEREVTAERIRDKIAASKQKGLWMGGNVPLGYDADGRTLRINPLEAEAVRTIFDLYLKYRNIRLVKKHSDRLGLRSKRRVSERSGKETGGIPLGRGHINAILTNPIYAGLIRHKKVIHEGKHKPIIDPTVFDQVQLLLRQRSRRPRGKPNSNQTSPFIGKLFDETGDRLTPTHANKKGVRHRYYVSRRLITGEAVGNQSTGTTNGGWRLPAKPLEDAICTQMANHLVTPDITAALLEDRPADRASLVIKRTKQLSSDIGSSPRLAAALVQTIHLVSGQITIKLKAEELTKRLELDIDWVEQHQHLLTIISVFQLRKRGVETKLLIGNTQATHIPDAILIQNIANARKWYQALKNGRSIDDIAKEQRTSRNRIQQAVHLAFIAPNIVSMILQGRQPVGLTSDRLIKSPLPIDWEQQRQLVQRTAR
jgi:site-specific DNA recombinase